MSSSSDSFILRGTGRPKKLIANLTGRDLRLKKQEIPQRCIIEISIVPGLFPAPMLGPPTCP